MFQTMIKRVVTNSNNNIIGTLQFLRLTSTLETHTRRKEFQKVKLIGTVYQNPVTLNDGAKAITVKTVASDKFYKVHRVIVRSPKILSILGNSISEGQRVYVAGDLRAGNYLNAQNQNREQLSIRANEVYVSKADTSTGENTASKIDQNSVSILSHIASEIIHLDNYSVFKLVSHHISRNPAEEPIEKPTFFAVFVHDKDLIKLLKSDLQRKDRVIVEGFLNSKPEADQNGVKKHAGFIEATNIFRVDRFSEAVNENVNESIQSTNE